jgi:hypothetical protein
MNNWKSKRKNPKELYKTLSLNELLPMNSRQYSTLKNQWADFANFLVDKYNLKGLNLTNCVVDVVWYQETKANTDYDNSYGGLKLLFDPLFVGSNMFVDDNHNHVAVLISDIRYDKDNPRMEIRITPCGKLKTRKEKLDLHFKIFD